MTNYDKSQEFLKAGLAPFGIKENKHPASGFHDWRKKKLIEPLKRITDEMEIAISISQCDFPIEIIDIDTKHDVRGGIFKEYKNEIKKLGYEYLLKDVVIQKTRSGGYHIAYKVDHELTDGNQKLTIRKESKEAVIETRGRGGYFMIHNVIQGSLLSLPTLTLTERDKLIEAARNLDEGHTYKSVDDSVIATRERSGGESIGSSPLDLYNDDADFHGLLLHHGWEFSHENSDVAFYVRPGKKVSDGHSGTLYKSDGIFVNFSTSVDLPQEKGMTAAAFLAHSEFGGSFSDLTIKLYEQGYGEKKITPKIGKVTKEVKEEAQKMLDAEEEVTEDLPRFHETLYYNAPSIIRQIVNLNDKGLDREVAFLSAYTAFSAILPGVHINYDGEDLYLNLFSYILGPAGQGKGSMARIRRALNVVNLWYKDNSANKFEIDEEGVRRDEEGNEVDEELIDLFLPGDISSAAIIEALSANDGYGILFETEADPLADTAKQEWGAGVTTIIRKAFHHENITVQRKTGKRKISIDEPKMSILLSSTASQFRRLLKSHENGTFSRMIYYWIGRVKKFKNPEKKISYKKEYERIGNEMTIIFEKLFDTELQVILPKGWGEEVQAWGQPLKDKLFDTEGEGLDAVVHRFAVMAMRISAITTVLNCYDTDSNKFTLPNKDFVMSEDDFYYGLHVCNILIDHSVEAFHQLGNISADHGRIMKIIQMSKRDGMSTRQIAEIYGDVSHMTIARVIKKFDSEADDETVTK